MKVYLNDYIAPSARARLAAQVELVDNYDNPEELDAVIVRQQYCPGDVIYRMKKCRLIQQHGTGLERIDLAAAAACGIPVRNTPGVNAQSVAEYAVMLMLALSRKARFVDQSVRQGALKTFGLPQTVGTELAGKSLGIVGSGNVARKTATIAHNGFGMQIICYNPHRTAEELCALGFRPVDSLQKLFAASDYVSLHNPYTPDSYHMIDASVLDYAKPGLILVNTARGGLVDEEALYHALVSGKLAAAGLDVFEKQPPDPDNPLLKLDQFIAGMHVAGSTYEAMERNGTAVVDAVFQALGIVESIHNSP